MKTRNIAMGLGMVVAVVAGAGVIWKKETPRKVAPVAEPVESGGMMIAERSSGSPEAPVVIYEFSDFQCPYCRVFWEQALPVIEKEYISTGKVRLVFLNYPLPRLHPNATAAHNFAMCAARQNRFWAAHNLLFQHQAKWEHQPDPTSFFRLLGDSASLDRQTLASCLERQTEGWLVQADASQAMGAGITGTPAFVVNGGLLTGAQPIEIWRPILDSVYRASRK